MRCNYLSSARNRTPSAPFLVLIMIALGLNACAADKDSRLLATQLRKMTAEYAADLTAKIEAERKFYLDSTKNLENTLNVVDPTAKEKPDVRQTLAYGRIITGTNSTALALTGELVDGTAPASTRPKLIAFIQTGIVSEDQTFQNARVEQSHSAQAMLTDFNALEQYQAKLTELTKQLAELEKPAPPGASFSQVEVLGQAVIDQLKGQSKAGQSKTK